MNSQTSPTVDFERIREITTPSQAGRLRLIWTHKSVKLPSLGNTLQC